MSFLDVKYHFWTAVQGICLLEQPGCEIVFPVQRTALGAKSGIQYLRGGRGQLGNMQ